MSFPTESVNNLGLTSSEITALTNLLANNSLNVVQLGSLKTANMNTTADQPITIGNGTSRYVITAIVVTNASTSLTLAVGGIYAAASKTTALVANTQIYSALTGATKQVSLTLGALIGTDTRSENTLYLALTTGQGGAATADIYIFGYILS